MLIKKEFKDLIPALTAEEFAQLEANCIAEGIRENILTWQGFIIDGHNRYEIAQTHGLPFGTQEKYFKDENAVREWMILNQFGRRNLSNYQRSVLALKLEGVYQAKAKEKQEKGINQFSLPQKSAEPPIETRRELAKVANVSHDTIAKVKTIQQKAAPEIKAKLETGEVSINQAYQEIKKEEKIAQRQLKRQELENTIEKIDNKEKYNFAIDNLQRGWYKVNNQFLYYGSNTDSEFINFLPQAKFAFADPPYNAGVDEWDYNFKWELDYLQNKANIIAVTPGGWNACNFYKETKMNYIWEMFCWISNGMTHGKCGYANVIKTSIFGNVKPKISQDFWKISIRVNETEDTQHKGRKPYEFMFHLLNLFTNECDIVIDPFAGSGTTLIMCEQMQRISYNAEINEQYCRLIFERAGNAIKI